MSELLFHLVPAVALSFTLHLFVHETGHMIGGFVTGWNFICVQLFHIILLKERGYFKLKLINRIGFQCIMYPKCIDQGARLYTLSGCISNVTLTVIAFIAMLNRQNNIIAWFYSWCIFAVGIATLILNGIPSTKRLCNDMACYLLLEKDPVTKQCHNAQMMIAHRLANGYSYIDIDQILICLPCKHAYNDILAYHAVLEYYYWLDKNNHELMQAAIHKIDDTAPISRSVLDIIKLERLYIDLFLKIKDKHYIEPDKYINPHFTEGDVHSIRVKTIYEAFESCINGNKNQAIEKINMGLADINTLPIIYSGEGSFCKRQLELIRDFIIDTKD